MLIGDTLGPRSFRVQSLTILRTSHPHRGTGLVPFGCATLKGDSMMTMPAHQRRRTQSWRIHP